MIWYNKFYMNPEAKTKEFKQPRVHAVLAYSYLFYFIAFLIGLFLDFIFSFKIFDQTFMMPTGVLFLVVASFLILWAQKVSRNLNKENLNKRTFMKGPYYFTRTPTHWGLTFLMLGFGIIANAIFIVLFAIFAFIITKFVFLKKEEAILAGKYGIPYLEYKRSVRF